MKRWKKLLIGVAVFTLVLGGTGYVIYGVGEHEGPGVVHPRPAPQRSVADKRARQQDAVSGLADTAPEAGLGAGSETGSDTGRDTGPVSPAKQILFGDLHVHTTFSVDAFLRSLPLAGGEGAHPPADACDFARFCSSLDFFALTDHAEALTPRHWRETRQSIRQCNAVAGAAEDPDLIAFAGWEWSQVGQTPETHYGHKNVIFRDIDDDRLPTRPIGSSGLVAAAFRGRGGLSLWTLATIPIREFSRRQRYLDLVTLRQEILAVDACRPGVDVHDLPEDCREVAPTPAVLFEKLAQWGHDALVIPHGTTWGFYTPPGYSYDKQIARAQHDPERQRLIEVYSGHGNSEESRAWRAQRGARGDSASGDSGTGSSDAGGNDSDSGIGDALSCPEPSAAYEPCCYRAGELIRARCGDDLPADECEARVRAARVDYMVAGTGGHNTVPGATVEDWGDCGQCRDCYAPAFSYRPGGAAQYILARGDFEDPERPNHVRMGFMASSDNHGARPGTGYKEFARRRMTEAAGPISAAWYARMFGETPAREPVSRPFDITDTSQPPFKLTHLDRQASFFLTGGLVAVHSEGRSRGAVWDALMRREVYGTSGPRILLWFDLLDSEPGASSENPGAAPATAPATPVGPAPATSPSTAPATSPATSPVTSPATSTIWPMGSEVRLAHVPRFAVRAVGAFVQQPGCPDWVSDELSPERIERLCAGECYYPGDQRHRITRIEVVRIRPQQAADEPVDPLIEDPWKTLPCPEDSAGCQVEFEDPEFVTAGRETVYYVRAIQEPTPAVNAGNLRCEDESCARPQPCYGDYRTPYEDDCLTESEERAWSSPIFIDFAATEPAQPGPGAPEAPEAIE